MKIKINKILILENLTTGQKVGLGVLGGAAVAGGATILGQDYINDELENLKNAPKIDDLKISKIDYKFDKNPMDIAKTIKPLGSNPEKFDLKDMKHVFSGQSILYDEKGNVIPSEKFNEYIDNSKRELMLKPEKKLLDTYKPYLIGAGALSGGTLTYGLSRSNSEKKKLNESTIPSYVKYGTGAALGGLAGYALINNIEPDIESDLMKTTIKKIDHVGLTAKAAEYNNTDKTASIEFDGSKPFLNNFQVQLKGDKEFRNLTDVAYPVMSNEMTKQAFNNIQTYLKGAGTVTGIGLGLAGTKIINDKLNKNKG